MVGPMVACSFQVASSVRPVYVVCHHTLGKKYLTCFLGVSSLCLFGSLCGRLLESIVEIKCFIFLPFLLLGGDLKLFCFPRITDTGSRKHTAGNRALLVATY